MNAKTFRNLGLPLAALLCAGAASCDDETTHDAHPDDHTDVHWSYSGETGPDHWGDLSAEYATCGSGVEQSPIDITGVTAGPVDGLVVHYAASGAAILNNGHTVQVNYDAGSNIELGGVTYQLKQFHFHADSEHTLDGEHAPLEMHLVHEAADGSLAVIGVLFAEGDENTALADVFANLPAQEIAATALDGVTINAADMLPESLDAWTYDGSLTTPACSEGVAWTVLAEPVEASPAQIGAFTTIFDHNYRPVQPLGARTIHGGEGHGDIHWSYTGETGPDHWGDLSEAWETCGSGVEQSPVDIAGVTPELVSTLVTNYAASGATILNNGHTVQVNYDAGSNIELDGVTYALKQFHFHADSEHTVEGEHAPIEMHLVHEAADGSLAVIGVMIIDGDENTALAGIFANLPSEETEATTLDGVAVNAADLLPASLEAWRYDGSLTTPPCSEGVAWTVLAEPIEASTAQIGAFTTIFDHNYRPVQPLGARTIQGGEGHAEVHWSYAGETGPDQWGGLSEAWATCGSGVEQSPIDLASADPGGLSALVTNYGPSAMNILNNGHTVQVNYDAGSNIELDGVTYELKQFHFHAESEHTFEGEHAPIEMHLVHEAGDGSLAVIGVMIIDGAENAALTDVFGNLPMTESEAELIDGVMVNAGDLLPAALDAWTYDGSLTTPPCTEGVAWTVMAEPIEASVAQIGAFTSLFDHNYRPVQPLGTRTIGSGN